MPDPLPNREGRIGKGSGSRDYPSMGYSMFPWHRPGDCCYSLSRRDNLASWERCLPTGCSWQHFHPCPQTALISSLQFVQQSLEYDSIPSLLLYLDSFSWQVLQMIDVLYSSTSTISNLFDINFFTPIVSQPLIDLSSIENDTVSAKLLLYPVQHPVLATLPNSNLSIR